MRRSSVVILLLALLPLACSKSPEEKLASHKAKAAEYLEKGKSEEAILELRNALQIAPKDKEALEKFGDALLKKGQVREAYAAFRKLAEVDPRNVNAQVRLGNLYLMGNALEEAKKAHGAALALAPERADVRMLSGNILLREGKTDEGLAAIDRAIALDAAKSEYKTAKAAVLMRLGRLPDARKLLDDLLGRESQNGAALLLLAQVADLQKDDAGAQGAFDRLLKAQPDQPGSWMSYGNYRLAKGDFPKAFEAFRKADQVGPKGTAGEERVADVSLGRNDLPEAKRAVAAIYAKNAKSVSAKYLEARVLLAERNPTEALLRLQDVAKQYPGNPEVHYYLGVAHHEQGNSQSALADVQKALELNPRLGRARLLLAEVQLRTRDFEGALKSTEGLKTDHPAVATLRAGALLGKGKPQEARKILEGPAAQNPNFPGIQQRLALCYLAENRPNDAVGALKKALKANAKDVEAMNLVSRVLLAQKKPEQAIALVEEQIKAGGETAGAREVLGKLYAARGDRARARQEFQRAIQVDPNAAQAYMLLARLHPYPDGVKAALADVEQAIAKQPKLVDAWMMKGSLHDALKQYPESEKAFRQALQLKPDFVPALNDLAWNLAEHGGNVDEALKFAEKAVELAPKLPAANDTLGWIYVKKGVFAKASPHLELAAAGLPDNPTVHYHLAKAYAGTGDSRKALGSFEQALKLSKDFPGADDARATVAKLQAEGKGKKG